MPESGCSIVVVGASAGGVEALQRFVRALPGDFPAPILVVLHASPNARSYLPEILTRAGALPAVHARDGAHLEPGHIYVAPPDTHLVVGDSVMTLGGGPRENGHRPAIDPLFRTAAAEYDSHVAGVILSGTLDDGTAGLFSVKEAGGATLVQDPSDALYKDMPRNAIEHVRPDYVQSVEEIADTLVRLTSSGRMKPGGDGGVGSADDPAGAAPKPDAEAAQPGKLVAFSCPECGGTLWETEAGGTTSYRCRVGHAYTLNSLIARHSETVERALWTAYRALEEQAAMAKRVSRRLAERGRVESSLRFGGRAEAAASQAEGLLQVLDGIVEADAGAAAEVEAD
jgi:two-component system chemotaxis response regulator CheB